MEELDKQTALNDIEDFMQALRTINSIQQAMYKRMVEIKNEMER